jgi:hypothetical protein
VKYLIKQETTDEQNEEKMPMSHYFIPIPQSRLMLMEMASVKLTLGKLDTGLKLSGI